MTESRCVLCVCAGARSLVFCSAAQRRVSQMCVCELYALDKSTLSGVRPALCHPSDHPDGDSVCFLHVCDIFELRCVYGGERKVVLCARLCLLCLRLLIVCTRPVCWMQKYRYAGGHIRKRLTGDVISENVKIPETTLREIKPCV